VMGLTSGAAMLWSAQSGHDHPQHEQRQHHGHHG
jgi:hypothetical protein